MKICENKRSRSHCLTFDAGLTYDDNFKHLLKSHWANGNKNHIQFPWAEGKQSGSHVVVYCCFTSTVNI